MSSVPAVAVLASKSAPESARRKRLSDWSVWSILKRRKSHLLGGLVLILANRAATLIVPLATKILLDDVIGKSNATLLLPLIGTIVAAYTLQASANLAVVRVLSGPALLLISEMRCRVQQHIVKLPLAFHDAHTVGELVSRTINDIDGLRNLVGAGLVEFLGGLVSSILAVCVMLAISPALTLITLLAMAVFAVFLRSVFGRMRPLFQERSVANAAMTARLTESLGGIRVVKAYNGEAGESAQFARDSERLVHNGLATLRLSSNTVFCTTLLTGVVGAAVTWVGGRMILDEGLRTGEFIMFMILLTYLSGPVLQVVNIGTQLSESAAGLARCRQILELDLEGDEPGRTNRIDAVQGDLRFENVGFAYAPGPDVLHDIEFHARAGSVTAFVGPSGSGKSTITGLAAGFYTPCSGRVLIDGCDMASVELASYRGHLGVVLQETFLFDGTIRENIMFSKPGASEVEFLEACRAVRLDEMVRQFPEGYETVVGERGVRLSGGQRQRISIARAMLADPRILILDEATSNLDSESEAVIQAAVARLMEGRTTLVIAHRLSTIRRADQILYIEEGRIAERGTHEQLLAARGKYHALCRRQSDLDSNLVVAPGEVQAETGETTEGEQKTTPVPALQIALSILQ